MKDLHKIFTVFKKEFPEVWAQYEALGKEFMKTEGLFRRRYGGLLR
jgi:hypothetical protein